MGKIFRKFDRTHRRKKAIAIFFKRYAAFRKQTESEICTRLFMEAEDIGDGILNIRVSEAWMTFPRPDKESIVKNLFNLWQTVYRPLATVLVILDPDGNTHMTMSSGSVKPTYLRG